MTFLGIATTDHVHVPIVFLLGCFSAIAVKKLRVVLELINAYVFPAATLSRYWRFW